MIDTAQAAQGPNLKVELTGQAIENVQPQKSSGSTALGVILALIVLGLAFGALFAAITPIVTALVAIGIGYDLTGLLSHVLTIVSFAPILGVLIGLGVGVDYALFIVTRHRSAVRAGRSIEDAAVNAVNTAGRAVFFAGLTVAIVLLGQFALGISFLDGAAVAATVTVALTMLASLTLLPALLGFIGPKVLSRRERRRISESGPQAEAVTSGLWYRWSRSIERQSALRAGVGLLVMVVVDPRDQRHRAGRGVPAGAHFLGPVRAVHGLRGVPRARMHEEWVRTGDDRAAITAGQTVTGRVITAAASIMILVFPSGPRCSPSADRRPVPRGLR